jgi:hypothetical protein
LDPLAGNDEVDTRGLQLALQSAEQFQTAPSLTDPTEGGPQIPGALRLIKDGERAAVQRPDLLE